MDARVKSPAEVAAMVEHFAAGVRVREALAEDPAVRIMAVREAEIARATPDDLRNMLQSARGWIRGMDAQVVALADENAALRRRVGGGDAA